METLWRDVRFALRQLLRERAFSAVVLLTLAVCIGANVAIFSVIDAVVLRPLPYPRAGDLVTIFNSYPGAGVPRASSAGIDYFLRRQKVAALDAVAVYSGSGNTVGDAGETARIETMRVSASFFPLLGVKAAAGRTFTEDENAAGQDQKAVLTDAFARERFGSAAVAVNRELRVDGRPFTVVGVLPPDFRFVVQPDVRFFVPIAFTDRERTMDSWHNNNYQMIGRLKPGATVQQATAQIAALNQSLVEQSDIPNVRQLIKDTGYHTEVIGAQADLLREVRGLLYLLWAGVAFVLLIGCVNVANLMLARSHVRLAELATRLALGAQRARLARQILTEAAVMALLGAALGTGLGALGLRALNGLGLETLPRGQEVSLDGRVLVFTLALALGAAVLFGVIPVAHVLKTDLNSVFREEGRSRTASRRTMVLRGSLATAQVALAFVLLMGAGLMVRSFRSAAAVDPGFRPDSVLTASVALPGSRYAEPDKRRAFTNDLLAQVRALPGVKAAGTASEIPFSGDFSSTVLFPEGWTPRPGESIVSPFRTSVGPGFFEALRIPVLEGRTFAESDGPGLPRLIVIDETLARRFWPNESPLGRRMIMGNAPGSKDIKDDDYGTIIGVVGTIKQNELTALGQVGAFYDDARYEALARPTLVVRAGADATAVTASLRRILAGLDPELPLFDVRPMSERVAKSLAPRRAAMVLLVVFGGVALFLAVVGIYGVLAYAVTQRTREVGIRMAIGSTPDRIFRLILAQGLAVTAVGLGVGGLASAGLVRLIRSQLFGVAPTDPLVLGVTAALLGAVALVACAIPAWRATRVDPVVALHG